jgi:hypothetical protein
MAQISSTHRVTATHPTPAYGPFAQLDAGASTMTVVFANQTLDSGGNAAIFTRWFWNTTPVLGGATLFHTSATFAALSAPFTEGPISLAGVPALAYVVASVDSNTAGNTNSVDLTYFDDAVNCAYGTRLQTGVKVTLVIDSVAIATAVAIFPELAFLEIAWGAMVGLAWSAGLVCNGPPPAFPAFTSADFLWGTQLPAPGSLAKFQQAWESVMWTQYCECVPGPGGGSPAAVPYRPLVPPTPPDVPAAPAPIVCDNQDLCASLDAINKQLTALTAQLSLVRLDVTLIQRQGVPFGYLHGTIHSALSNDGDFTVSDILGLAVTFTTLPGIYDPTVGDPDTYHQIGKISVGTIDGWLRSWQPTHSPYMILDISGAITKVGYSFKPGIVTTITELIHEP